MTSANKVWGLLYRLHGPNKAIAGSTPIIAQAMDLNGRSNSETT
jgi:hypothetical protein